MRNGKVLLWASALMLPVAVASRSVAATSQVIESWEGSANGWTTSSENSAYSIVGPVTTPGVTDGANSLQIDGTANLTYGQLLDGPSTTDNTALLATANSVSIDVYNTDIGLFGGFQQWSLVLNGGGLGYHSVDGFSYSQTGATGEKTLTWTLADADRATLAANLATATQIIFQVGSGGNAGDARSIYIDNLRADLPEPGAIGLASVAALAALVRRRGRRD